LTISFIDQNTNNPTSWSWNFGDGNTSLEQNLMHTYSAAGNYTVTLTASKTESSSAVTKFSYIAISNGFEVPISNFSASPTSGNTPLTVNFTDMSTGSPTSWYWDFGDGIN
jgi:PKD repeat protein